MPEYPIKCTCGFRGDIFERAANSDNLICPQCSNRCEQDYERKGVPAVGNRTFAPAKRESLMEGWHPKEVREVRERLGERYGQCVQADGSVHFRDRDEQRGYVRALDSLTDKLKAEAHASNEQDRRRGVEKKPRKAAKKTQTPIPSRE